MKKVLRVIPFLISMISLHAVEQPFYPVPELAQYKERGQIYVQGWPTQIVRGVVKQYEKEKKQINLAIDFFNMRYLFEGFFTGMLNLKSLTLANCPEYLPHDFLSLESVEELCIHSSLLQKMPASLATMKGLTALVLEGGSPLVEFPAGITELANLNSLSLDFSRSSIKAIPADLSKLAKLSYLAIYGKQFKKFPFAFDPSKKVELVVEVVSAQGPNQIIALPLSVLPDTLFEKSPSAPALPNLAVMKFDLDRSLLSTQAQKIVQTATADDKAIAALEYLPCFLHWYSKDEESVAPISTQASVVTDKKEAPGKK